MSIKRVMDPPIYSTDAPAMERDISPPQTNRNDFNFRDFEGVTDFRARSIAFNISGGHYYADQTTSPAMTTHTAVEQGIKSLGLTMNICCNSNSASVGNVSYRVVAGNIYGDTTKTVTPTEPIIAGEAQHTASSRQPLDPDLS